MNFRASTPPLAEVLSALQHETKESLVELLAELAATCPDVADRLARRALTGAPAQLAAVLRDRLEDLKRSQVDFGRGGSSRFGRTLEAWLNEVERELLPLDPARAHELVEAFIKSDGDFYEQVNDADAEIDNALSAGCRLWLKTARAHPNQAMDFWVEQVYALKNTGDYGGREALLTEANVLFDAPGLRALVARYEADLDHALRARDAGQRDHGVNVAAANIGMVADALRDPDLFAKITLRVSPELNVTQEERIAQRYLRFGHPQEALRWLAGNWNLHESQRQHLLAEVYAATGDMPRLREVREALFKRSGSTGDFAAWRESLPPEQQGGAVQCAHQHAQTLEDPIAGARLLLALDDDAAAEALLLARRAKVQGDAYYELVPLAKALENKNRPRGAIVCYRALLLAILTRAYARAYEHGVDYLRALRRLDTHVHDYGGLEPHDAFETTIRRQHARKSSFWGRL